MGTTVKPLPWGVFRIEDYTFRSILVREFRKRQDAEDYLNILQKLRPDLIYTMAYQTSDRN